MHVGLGLAVVARIVEQLGGQLRVDSKPTEGSRFSILIPLTIYDESVPRLQSLKPTDALGLGALRTSRNRTSSEIEDIVEALGTNPLGPVPSTGRGKSLSPNSSKQSISSPKDGKFDIPDSAYPLKRIKVDSFDIESSLSNSRVHPNPSANLIMSSNSRTVPTRKSSLRILIVEVSFVT